MLESGASRWLEPELSATVRAPAASAAITAATRAVRRDIISSWERGWTSGDAPGTHARLTLGRASAAGANRSRSARLGQVDASGLALHGDRVVEALEGRLAPVPDDVRAQGHDGAPLEVLVPVGVVGDRRLE